MRKPLEAAGLAVATVFGAGCAPAAPGTAGSLVCVLFFIALSPGPAVRWILCAPLLILGYWGSRAGREEWGPDPPRVVIDEFAGCWVALLAVPAAGGYVETAAAFVLFRLFDILKPWPVSVFDRMDSAAGILLDDVASGVLAALAVLGGIHVLEYF